MTLSIDQLLGQLESPLPDFQKLGILRNLHVLLLSMSDSQRERYKQLFAEYGPRFRSSSSSQCQS